MLPLDPEYVAEMTAEGYDPHLSTCVATGIMSLEDAEWYKKVKSKEITLETTKDQNRWDMLDHLRGVGKVVVYSSAYGAGPSTIARNAGVSKGEGEQLHTGYWELNWSLKAIAEEQVVVTTSRNERWLIHPIVGIALSLRSDKDRFNVACQGGGSFFHFNWVFGVLNRQKEEWGVKSITGNIHDELIIVCKNSKNFVDSISEMINDSIKEVSAVYNLRRELGCDIQTGYRYANVH